MGFMDKLRTMIGPVAEQDTEYWVHKERRLRLERGDSGAIQTRAIDSFTTYPDWDTQVLAAQGLTSRPWRYPSINEALGVPAIFRAVALISNTTGSLALEAFRNGVKLDDDRVPQLVKRPDPFRIPRDFYRDTAFDLATRGEFWWWIAARDLDNNALSLIRIPPWEVQVRETNDRLRPRIFWKDREMRREDLRHGTFLPDSTGYRGVGPLQMCGAAMSVAVEAQEWAANFYINGNPSYLIKSASELSEDPETGVHEADTLRDQVMGRDSNTAMVIDPGIEDVEAFPVNEQGGQMLQGREASNGDAARMYGIPGELLEYSSKGSSLTYQNVAEVFTRFVKTPLGPDYLEPIEQHMSDLLPRATVARFSVKGILRADVKTRWEVYNLAVSVLGQEAAAELAREGEGLTPGDVEYAPIPFSPPAAVPTDLPITRTEAPMPVVVPQGEVRCSGKRVLRGVMRPCNKKLAEAPPFLGRCERCGKDYTAAA